MNAPQFTPRKSVRGTVIRHINYTCNPEQYARLKALAAGHNISLKDMLRQMVDFALEHSA
jgi:hypothetical protein